jgi:hypothetical protein
LTAGWGRHNQFPSGAQVLPEFGNPLLMHLRADHSVLGIARRFDGGWSWKAEAYYKMFSDLVAADPVVNYVNAGSGHAYGLELLLKKDLTARWSGWLALSLARSERENDLTGESFPFDYDQPVNTALVVNYRLSGNWSFGAKWTYHTGTPYTPIIGTGTYPDGRIRPIYGAVNSERLPDYHRLDLRIDRNFTFNTWKLKTYLEIINAYAHDNVAGYDYSADYSSRDPIYQLPWFPSIGVQGEF